MYFSKLKKWRQYEKVYGKCSRIFVVEFEQAFATSSYENPFQK